MTQRIALAVFISAGLVSAGALGACPADHSKKNQTAKPPAHPTTGNCVDLGALPQISATIVGHEPSSTAKNTAAVDPTSTPYEGPTLGLTKPNPGVMPTPTVGYKWSLE